MMAEKRREEARVHKQLTSPRVLIDSTLVFQMKKYTKNIFSYAEAVQKIIGAESIRLMLKEHPSLNIFLRTLSKQNGTLESCILFCLSFI